MKQGDVYYNVHSKRYYVITATSKDYATLVSEKGNITRHYFFEMNKGYTYVKHYNTWIEAVQHFKEF